jgi:hypothetical protein
VTAPKRRKPISGPSQPAAKAPKSKTAKTVPSNDGLVRRRAIVAAAAAVVVAGLVVGGIFLVGNSDNSAPAAAAVATGTSQPSSAATAPTPAPTADAGSTPQVPAGQPSFAVPTATGLLSTDPACTGYISATGTFGSAMSATGANQQTLTDAMSAFIPSMEAAEASAKNPEVKSAITVETDYFQANGPAVITAILAQNQTFLSAMPFLNADAYLAAVCTPATS